MSFRYTLAPRKIALILGGIALFLAAQSFYSEYLVETYLGGGSSSLLGSVLDLFSVNLEQSIPTWYSALLLFFAAILLTVIATAKRASQDRDTRYWFGLALVFSYLSLDESAVIHEILSDPLQAGLHTSGYLAFGWQIAAIPLVIILALVYLRFLLHLPARTRILFLVAGGLYVGGAVIVDAISANEWAQANGISLLYLGIGTLEELLEMLGVVVFIFALLQYLVSLKYAVTFQSAPALVQTPVSSAATDRTQADSPAATVSTTFWSQGLFRLVILAMVVVVMNGVFLTGARSEASTPPDPSQDSVLAYQAILAQPGANQVTVTRTAGIFGMDRLGSQQVAAAHLTLFDQVMVVALPSAASSLILSGDPLPFDQATLSEVLRANGVTQFIVFDTPAVRQMTAIP